MIEVMDYLWTILMFTMDLHRTIAVRLSDSCDNWQSTQQLKEE